MLRHTGSPASNAAQRIFSKLHVVAVLCAGSTVLWCATSVEAVITKGNITIRLETVAAGLTSPVHLTHAGDGSGRLFIVDQAGQIRVVDNGLLLPTPFLDITDRIVTVNPGFDERGVLGLAFHPDYSSNGRFFVRYSAPRTGVVGEPCFGTSRGCHEEILSEFSAPNPASNVADPNSETILFRIDEPQFNHDAGTVAFGPDGFLYFSLGDGGGANDSLDDPNLPHGSIGNGQNIETALGSMLRIDVDSPAQLPLAYAIPPDNPFVNTNGVDEIFAYGFRNPYRFSFDDGPDGAGLLFVADVGQNLFEEIDVVSNGGNYGWVIREGANCFDPFNPSTPPASCNTNGLIDPLAEYTHAEGGTAIVGGYVYRGSLNPGLVGTYVFGDFTGTFAAPGSGRLYFLDEPSPGTFAVKEFIIGPDDTPYGQFLKGFGEDEDGEVYVLGSIVLAPTGSTGIVQRIVVVGDCDGDRNVDLVDHLKINACLSGPDGGVAAGCECVDIDGDNDVDVHDFGGFQRIFDDPLCGNGALDAGEECDDGNTAGGDGCSALCTNELAQCTIGFELSCPDVTPECGATFTGGTTCIFAGLPFCYSSGLRSFGVTSASSPLTITLDADLNKLSVFFAGESGGTGTMTFFDAFGMPVGPPIDALGNCALAMPPKQTVTFSRPVRSVEVTAVGRVWIDDFRVNPP